VDRQAGAPDPGLHDVLVRDAGRSDVAVRACKVACHAQEVEPVCSLFGAPNTHESCRHRSDSRDGPVHDAGCTLMALLRQSV